MYSHHTVNGTPTLMWNHGVCQMHSVFLSILSSLSFNTPRSHYFLYATKDSSQWCVDAPLCFPLNARSYPSNISLSCISYISSATRTLAGFCVSFPPITIVFCRCFDLSWWMPCYRATSDLCRNKITVISYKDTWDLSWPQNLFL